MVTSVFQLIWQLKVLKVLMVLMVLKVLRGLECDDYVVDDR